MTCPKTKAFFSSAESLIRTCKSAVAAAKLVESKAHEKIYTSVVKDGKISPAKVNAQQFSVHGYAWLATYCEALNQLLKWAQRLETDGLLGELEQLILMAGFGEYLAQIKGGIAMSQVEIIRLIDLGIDAETEKKYETPEVTELIRRGTSSQTRAAIADLIY